MSSWPGSFWVGPGYEALIPEHYIHDLVGGNSLWANFFAAVAGAFMYFATLTEVPILQGLIGSGMGQGPALALLLAGPALSLPSMITLAGIMGVKKTLTYCTIVVVLGHDYRHRLRLAHGIECCGSSSVPSRRSPAQQDPVTIPLKAAVN